MKNVLCIGGPLDGQRIISDARIIHAPEGDPAMTNMRYDRVRLASGPEKVHEVFIATTVSDPIEALIAGYRHERFKLRVALSV